MEPGERLIVEFAASQREQVQLLARVRKSLPVGGERSTPSGYFQLVLERFA